jgi:hypothetical protein
MVFAMLDFNTCLYYLDADAEIGIIIAPDKWKGLVSFRGAVIPMVHLEKGSGSIQIVP